MSGGSLGGAQLGLVLPAARRFLGWAAGGRECTCHRPGKRLCGVVPWRAVSLRSGAAPWSPRAKECGPPLFGGVRVLRIWPTMTRWARQSGAPGEKALDATPWEEMEGQGRPDLLLLKKEQEKRKKKKKKKDYQNEDVNGFAAFLKQSSGSGEVAGADSADLEKEVAIALKKDKRREGRRLKRQEMKKNAMVSSVCSHRCLSLRGSLLRTWGKICV